MIAAFCPWLQSYLEKEQNNVWGKYLGLSDTGYGPEWIN